VCSPQENPARDEPRNLADVDRGLVDDCGQFGTDPTGSAYARRSARGQPVVGWMPARSATAGRGSPATSSP